MLLVVRSYPPRLRTIGCNVAGLRYGSVQYDLVIAAFMSATVCQCSRSPSCVLPVDDRASSRPPSGTRTMETHPIVSPQPNRVHIVLPAFMPFPALSVGFFSRIVFAEVALRFPFIAIATDGYEEIRHKRVEVGNAPTPWTPVSALHLLISLIRLRKSIRIRK